MIVNKFPRLFLWIARISWSIAAFIWLIRFFQTGELPYIAATFIELGLVILSFL